MRILMTKKILSVIILICTFFISCTEDAVDDKAIQVTVSEVKSMTGYDWFSSAYEIYKPNKLYVDSIKDTYKSANQKIIIFCKPSCYCESGVEVFADAIKAINSAGINEPNILLYSMLKTTSENPYSSEIVLNYLPSVYIQKDGKMIYSAVDSLRKYVADTTKKIEYYILEGLRK